MTHTHTPDPVDVHVGDRIRCRRVMIGQSQQALAAALGITFQQVQKYERGDNRISASRMFRAARSQGVEPNYYFEGLAEAAQVRELTEDMRGAVAWLRSPEALSVAVAIAKLPPLLQAAVERVAKSFETLNP